MSGLGAAVLPWVHPAAGLATVALAARAASLGFAARRGGPGGRRHRGAHRALTPWVLGLAAANWLGGIVTVWAVREDLDVAASGHFTCGSAIVVLLALAAVVSRRIGRAPWARRLHPWLGATALVLCGVQVFLGLELTRW